MSQARKNYTVLVGLSEGSVRDGVPHIGVTPFELTEKIRESGSSNMGLVSVFSTLGGLLARECTERSRVEVADGGSRIEYHITELGAEVLQHADSQEVTGAMIRQIRGS